MNIADWGVIALYLLGSLIIGVHAMNRVKDTASYFIGDRKYGHWMMIFFSFGAGTHSDQAVGVASKTFRVGASGIWYQWIYLLATPFYWLIPPMMRRMRAVTTADYFDVRYGPTVAVLYGFTGALQLVVSIAVMLKGTQAMITACSGGHIPPIPATIGMTVLFVVYGMAGGMAAAIATNFIQGILTIVLSFMLLPAALDAVGGMAGLRETLDPQMLKIVTAQEITLFYVIMVGFNGLIGWPVQPHSMANAAAGKTELEGRVGVTGGNFIKRVCTIAWMLTGLAAVAYYAGKPVENTDLVFGEMAYVLLPRISAGLIGLFMASMLASVMSSCDTFMTAAAGLFIENIYRPLLVRNKSHKHYILAGRVASLVIVGFGVWLALEFESVLKGLETFWMIAAMMGMAFWVGLYWRGATAAGAWASTLVSFVLMLFTSDISLGSLKWEFNARFAGYLPEFMLYQGKLTIPWQMTIYLAAGLVVLVVVSWFTKKRDKAILDKIFASLRTPIGKDEPECGPFTLPPGVEPAPRKVLIDIPGFEIPRASVVGMAGFIGSWLFAGFLIWVVYWILG